MVMSKSITHGAGDYLGALRRRSIYLMTLLPAPVFLSVLAAYTIAPLYQSSATIMLELSSVPKDIIETTVISYADQHIEIIQGRVMTVDGLTRIVHDIDPYPKHKEWSAEQKAQRILENTSLERVDPISLKPTSESNAFSLHYNNPDPVIAAAIDKRLAQLFLTYNQVVRTEAAEEAAGFLQKQSDGIAQQMREIDVRIAEVKRKYGEALPELLMRNQTIVEDLLRQLDTLQTQILTAQEKESVLALQLSQLNPNLISESGDLTDVATVRAKLTEAEQRYTPDHPEVKRLKKALENLVAQNENQHGAKQTANNPQYLLTDAELKAARNELANLQAQANATRAKLEQRRALVGQTPAAEREVAEVMRRKFGGNLRESAGRRALRDGSGAQCFRIARFPEQNRADDARIGHRSGPCGRGCGVDREPGQKRAGRERPDAPRWSGRARNDPLYQEQVGPSPPRDYVQLLRGRLFRGVCRRRRCDSIGSPSLIEVPILCPPAWSTGNHVDN
jgi:uncharacterized protein involved in exopolysaccharide biosynthesis